MDHTIHENNILNVLKQCFETAVPAKDARTAVTHLAFVVNLVFCFLGDSKTFSLETVRRSMISHLNQSISRSAFWDRLSGNRLRRSLHDLITELMAKFSALHQVNKTILKKHGVTGLDHRLVHRC
jgi:hypothetical protein